jgi:hypothetical protein
MIILSGYLLKLCLDNTKESYIKDPIVFWLPKSSGHTLRNCFFNGMYSSTVWTSGINDDFNYRNNVVKMLIIFGFIKVQISRQQTRRDGELIFHQ